MFILKLNKLLVLLAVKVIVTGCSKFLKTEDEYFNSHNELKNMVKAKDEGIKEARLTFIVWSRAYQKMALGKSNPAEWFDVSESGNLLMGTAGRAVGI